MEISTGRKEHFAPGKNREKWLFPSRKTFLLHLCFQVHATAPGRYHALKRLICNKPKVQVLAIMRNSYFGWNTSLFQPIHPYHFALHLMGTRITRILEQYKSLMVFQSGATFVAVWGGTFEQQTLFADILDIQRPWTLTNDKLFHRQAFSFVAFPAKGGLILLNNVKQLRGLTQDANHPISLELSA